MAATGPSRRALLVMAAAAVCARADDSADIHAAIAGVGESLSSGEPAQAMIFFSKSCPDYDKLAAFFDVLTAAYSVENQIDFTDEEIESGEATASVHWALTLATRQSGLTSNRESDLSVKLKREGKNWRIVQLTPIAIFDPQGSREDRYDE